MADMLQLFVKFGSERRIVIKIHKDASVEDLMKTLTHWIGVDSSDYRVLFEVSELQVTKQGKKMYLSDYHLLDRSNLFVVMQVSGGNDPDTPKQLDDDVELTDLPDMITWDDDPNNKRAKMPCGHAIGPESLTAYCRSILTSGKWQLQCPYIDKENSTYCGHVWEYFVVRRLAVLTEDEKKYFETRMSENYMRRSVGIQECPKCTVFCTRKSSKDRRVSCLYCRKSGKAFDFCWYCLGEWNSSGTRNCGNTACTGKDPRVKILETAPNKTIVGLAGCPSMRACPKCGMLIQHTEACKQMKCICGQKFCFICLKKAGDDGRYRCGTYNSHCKIAPRQEEIDNSGKEDNEIEGGQSNGSWCTIM
ncbi:E3 ubiquitin-protein ligase DDB_G0292642-like [Argopecten irradians]|uniref:E3 ubiquitin-protein ligase DDB_G0292642-like n=1 Tax=Argopecten irradians TaxID=31199 RepID=UPI00371D217C